MRLNQGNDLATVADRLEEVLTKEDRAVMYRAAYDLQEYAARLERLLYALTEPSKAKRENIRKTVETELSA